MAGGLISLDVASSAIYADRRSRGAATPAFNDVTANSDIELETTYALRRREMIRFLVHYGIDFVEAEDITQEVFLNALKTPERKRVSDHLFRWLLVCAKNMAFNRQKKERREMLAPSALWRRWEETIGDTTPGADIRIQEREKWERFYQALSHLNATEQQCVLLRCQGRTFREIGLALNVPQRSAIYTTSSALQKMQSVLESA